MRDSFTFFVQNIFSVLLITLFVLLLIKGLINGVVKELLGLLTLFISYVVAINFFTYKLYLFDDLIFSKETNQILVLFVFFLLTYGACWLPSYFIGGKVKSKLSLKTVPVSIILASCSFILWADLIFTVISRYFPTLHDDMRSSFLFYYLETMNQLLKQFVFSYLNFLE